MLELLLRTKQPQQLIHKVNVAEVNVAVVDPKDQPEVFHMVDVLVKNQDHPVELMQAVDKAVEKAVDAAVKHLQQTTKVRPSTPRNTRSLALTLKLSKWRRH